MKPFLKYISISFIIIFLSSCSYFNNFKRNNNNNNNQELNSKDINMKNKQKLEVKISCGKGNINNFLDKGWKIKKEYSEEKICSWKSIPANNKCNIEKDKGCKIIKPDKIGIETFYLLEK